MPIFIPAKGIYIKTTLFIREKSYILLKCDNIIMLQQFINRKEELSILSRRYESKKPEFLIIYGRRRVGKTELITHSMR